MARLTTKTEIQNGIRIWELELQEKPNSALAKRKLKAFKYLEKQIGNRESAELPESVIKEFSKIANTPTNNDRN